MDIPHYPHDGQFGMEITWVAHRIQRDWWRDRCIQAMALLDDADTWGMGKEVRALEAAIAKAQGA